MFPVVAYRKGKPAYYSKYNNNLCYDNTNGYSAKVNISEDENQFVVEVYAPGVSKKEFKISLEKDVLTVSAEINRDENQEKNDFLRKEFQKQSFKKSFGLPESADQEKINANYNNGILSVLIPKKEEAKPKPAIDIKVS